MTNLNGWQRLWVVLTTLWVALFAIALAAIGLPAVYEAPVLTSWTMTCTLKDVVERLVSSEESEADIARVVQAAGKRETVAIEFWRPEGDKSDTPSLDCSKAALVYNPTTKQKQLTVFVRLDTYGDFRSGYDVESALGDEIVQRIDQSKRERRRLLWLGLGAALGLPALLYGLGASVAWIRRGFRSGGAR
jgi:hypothetical protein